MKNIIGILFLLGISSVSLCQNIRNFSAEPDKYFDELTQFMTASYEGGTAIMEEFHAIWKLDKLDEKQQEQVYKIANKALKARMKAKGDSVSFVYGISSRKLTDKQIEFIYKTSNSMLKKRMKPSPHYRDYLLTLINFTISDQTEESFAAWQKSLDKLIQKSARKVTAYLDFSNKLFSENLLYKSPSVVWKSSNKRYTFEYDSLPKIVFKELDLICYSKNDSSVIEKTTGSCYPTEKVWVGEGGKVNWKRAGLEEEKVRASLSRYKIKLKSASYQADSVTFYNTNYFDYPLIGKLTEKIKPNITIKKATYPRFESYDKRLVIKDLFKNVDYNGGFSMQGAKLIGSGSKEEDAYITFKLYYENDSIKRNQEKFLIAASKKFIIEEDRITSSKTAITIYIEKDSIYHPQLKLKFLVKRINDKEVGRELILIRENKGLAKSPYFNSYHQVEMNFEALYWDIDHPKMTFKRLKGIGDESFANFESADFYRRSKYDKIQGIDEVHPLVEIKQFMKASGGHKEFYTNELADFLRMDITYVRQTVMHLSNMGFLIYNFDEDRIIVKEKTFEYLADNAGKRDYDVINFNSRTEKNEPNATFNLLNYDIKMHGVASIFLSDSQNVYIYPSNQELVLKKNRDFDFAGRIHAGLFDFFGREFSFEYDNFKLNLDNVDSLRMSIKGEPDRNGDYKLIRIKTVIEQINGELQIDKPGNKSGVKPSPRYPIFHSQKDSYTYYDKTSIQGGVYARDSFYFHLEPFTLDSLDDFDPFAIALKGKFVSGGIFPDFEENLGIQPDHSLGFVRPTPENGFKVYNDKGKYTANINLSHRGLRGDGTLNYLISTALSDDFIFFPDSMNAIAQKYDIKKTAGPVEYPSLVAENVDIHWEPYNDIMHVENIDKPMVMFDSEAKHSGSVDLEPIGLSGEGNIKFGDAELTSNLMKFHQTDFDSDTADFKLSTADLAEVAFNTVNVKAHIDFKDRKGIFESNGEGSFVEFPANQYYCYVDKFTWFMDRGDIELSASKQQTTIEGDEDVKLEGSEFISTNPKQDSLRFVAPRAEYSVKKSIIKAREVQFINVADARIYPDSGNVTIYKKARMKPFINSKILANTVTKYHNIYNADIEVTARKMYTATGDYDYIDENKSKQTIHFNQITVDTTAQTYALGILDDTVSFMLSPKFAFLGDVKLTASNEFLNFSGFAKIGHSCKAIISNWFKFTEDINPNSIYIPVELNPTNITDDSISSGILLGKDSAYAYSTFLSLRPNEYDINVMTADGYLVYDKGPKAYRISNKDKLTEISLPGNLISLRTKGCTVYGEGKINLGQDIGRVNMITVGNATNNLKDKSTNFDVLMVLDFFFDDGAMKTMAEDFIKETTVDAIDYNRTVYERGLGEIVGKETADKLISEINLYGSYKKMPNELLHTLVFTDLKLKWNDSTSSYISDGLIGLGNINKKQINKSVEGYIELVKKRSGDILTIYLQATEDKWYFFSYQRGLMQAISSNEDFNTIVKEVKAAKRKMKAEKGKAPYQYIISSVRKKKSFVQKFNN